MLPRAPPTSLPIAALAADMPAYLEADWSGDALVLSTGARYLRHGTWPDGGGPAQIWARRDDTALDVVTVDGRLVAFVAPRPLRA